MDLATQKEILLRVREESDEMFGTEPEERALYTGIFHVRLNATVQITFVPRFERDVNSWPPVLPPVNGLMFPVTNVQQARLLTAALEDYTVTVGTAHECEEAPFLLPGFDDVPQHEGILYLVTQNIFTQFQRELADVAETTPNVYSGRLLSELQDKGFVQYLLSKVICSPYFRKADAWALHERTLLTK